MTVEHRFDMRLRMVTIVKLLLANGAEINSKDVLESDITIVYHYQEEARGRGQALATFSICVINTLSVREIDFTFYDQPYRYSTYHFYGDSFLEDPCFLLLPGCITHLQMMEPHLRLLSTIHEHGNSC